MCEQMLEIIFLQGGKATISETPLFPKSLVEISKTINKGSDYFSTSCYRGYVGVWEIKDNPCFLQVRTAYSFSVLMSCSFQ